MSRGYPAGFVVAVMVSASGIGLLSLWAEEPGTPPANLDRYLSHVSTDKPIYRTGEKVYIRDVILKANTHEPLKSEPVQAMIEIHGPKGDVVAGGYVNGEDSVAGFTWSIPAEQPGGEYTVKVTYPFHGFPPAERKFDIRAYRAPRLKNQIVFLRDGYGPSDEASATLHVERAEGGVPAGAKVTVSARVDESEVFTGPATIDAQGNCTGRFKLPAKIERGLGTLSFAIEDGGVVETASKTIPILLQTVDLQLYPEGGDLVAGLPARVYIEAKTPARKPADIAGQIVDENGAQVATFRTEHEGRGRFALTPAKGGQYTLKITEPTGINTTYPLPAVKNTGVVLTSTLDITAAEEPILLRAIATEGGMLKISLRSHDQIVASTKIKIKLGAATDVALTPPPSASGVLIATVWDEQNTPLAERLIYRQPAGALRVKLITEQKTYVPGDKVKLNIETTDEHGEPISAVVGLAVTDDSVQELIEKREQAPRLPVMVMLEPEVRELADAHVYLDPENPKAPLATDLLLGTQGWRRFAFVDTAKFITAYGDSARRTLAWRDPVQMNRALGVGGGRGFGGFGGFAGGRRDGGRERLEGQEPAMLAPAGAVRELKEDAVDNLAAIDDRPKAAPAQLPVAAGLIVADAELPKEQARVELKQGLEIAAKRIAMDRRQSDMAVIRVYAHDLRPGRQPNDRVDFAETLYWHAGLRTDAKTGKAAASFALNDAVTSFRVAADAFSDTGALGQGQSSIESVEPFYFEPKLPLEVTAGDVILLPIGLVNGLSQDLSGVRIQAKGAKELNISELAPFDLKAKARVRQLLNVGVGAMNGPTDFVIEAKAGTYGDKVTRPLTVRPLGFPMEVAFGGLIGPDSSLVKVLTIPKSRVNRSLLASVTVYPTPLANMTEALERLIQEPNGCFEQTSSTAYPLVMAQQYFLSHTGVQPALIERSKAMLEKGYARLKGFECKQKGYEWFGSDPGNESLTAYGLLEFTDMAQVREVDSLMIERTRDWLLKRRDGKGGFMLDTKALDSFGRAPAATTAAYITWALLEAGQKALEPELAALKQQAESTKDSYILALAANALALAGDDTGAKRCRETLIKKQQKDGSVADGLTSITCSGGEALTIETTSLAVLAWVRDPACAAAVENGIHYLAESCKSGRYGSTQSTVLALRAIIQYDKLRARPKAAGKVQVLVDGRPMGDAMAFDPDTQGAIHLPDITELLEPGEHRIELKMQGGSIMPYALSVRYNDTTPASAPECKVGMRVSLASKALTEGDITEAQVVVTNRSKVDGIPTPIAIIGLPGGLEPRHDQLKELVKSGTVAAYEVIGREVVLYWRQLGPGQEVRLPISLVAAIPGTYTGPASRAYLYYTDEYKTWVDGVKVQIRPR